MYNRAWQLAWKTVRPDFPLGLEFLMNMRVNTLWQKIKAPRLWSLHSVHSGWWVIRTSHADDQRPGLVTWLLCSCELLG